MIRRELDAALDVSLIGLDAAGLGPATARDAIRAAAAAGCTWCLVDLRLPHAHLIEALDGGGLDVIAIASAGCVLPPRSLAGIAWAGTRGTAPAGTRHGACDPAGPATADFILAARPEAGLPDGDAPILLRLRPHADPRLQAIADEAECPLAALSLSPWLCCDGVRAIAVPADDATGAAELAGLVHIPRQAELDAIAAATT